MTDEVSAREYHDRTKHSPESVGGGRLNFDNKPIPYKIYENLDSVDLASRIHAPEIPTLSSVADKSESENRHTNTPKIEELTTLCYYSSGITKKLDVYGTGEKKAFRAASCTGALYHIDLYLVTKNLDGLDAGVYHFDPRKLSLDVLREGDYRSVLADVTAGDESVEKAPVVFIVTSTWWRNAWKYEERSYRHAFWDSGTVIANLLATSNALDFPAKVVTSFSDPAVSKLLGLGTEKEAPLELIPVGVTDDYPPEVEGVENVDFETRPLSKNEKEFDLIHRAYRASSLRNREEVEEWRSRLPLSSFEPNEPNSGNEVFELDPVDHETQAKTPLHLTIKRRGSCREYKRESISFRKFSTVLDRATRGFSSDFCDLVLCLNDLYLVVNAVEDIPSGKYLYHPESSELELLEEGNFRPESRHIALDQDLGGEASVCGYFMTDLDRVTDVLGDRGYRAAQLEGAITGGKLYLASYSHRDLGATGLTFYDDEVTRFFGPRADGMTPTFLITLGRPA